MDNKKEIICPNCKIRSIVEVPKKGIIFHDTCLHCKKYMSYNYKGKIVGVGNPIKNFFGI